MIAVDRPVLRCLIGVVLDDGEIYRRLVTLAQAVALRDKGYALHVLVDPADECDLATYERRERTGLE